MVSTAKEFTIKPLEGATWPAFASLVESCDGFLDAGAWDFIPRASARSRRPSTVNARKIGKHRWVVNRFVESSR